MSKAGRWSHRTSFLVHSAVKYLREEKEEPTSTSFDIVSRHSEELGLEQYRSQSAILNFYNGVMRDIKNGVKSPRKRFAMTPPHGDAGAELLEQVEKNEIFLDKLISDPTSVKPKKKQPQQSISERKDVNKSAGFTAKRLKSQDTLNMEVSSPLKSRDGEKKIVRKIPNSTRKSVRVASLPEIDYSKETISNVEENAVVSANDGGTSKAEKENETKSEKEIKIEKSSRKKKKPITSNNNKKRRVDSVYVVPPNTDEYIPPSNRTFVPFTSYDEIARTYQRHAVYGIPKTVYIPPDYEKRWLTLPEEYRLNYGKLWWVQDVSEKYKLTWPALTLPPFAVDNIFGYSANPSKAADQFMDYLIESENKAKFDKFFVFWFGGDKGTVSVVSRSRMTEWTPYSIRKFSRKVRLALAKKPKKWKGKAGKGDAVLMKRLREIQGGVKDVFLFMESKPRTKFLQCVFEHCGYTLGSSILTPPEVSTKYSDPKDIGNLEGNKLEGFLAEIERLLSIFIESRASGVLDKSYPAMNEEDLDWRLKQLEAVTVDSLTPSIKRVMEKLLVIAQTRVGEAVEDKMLLKNSISIATTWVVQATLQENETSDDAQDR